MVGPFVQDYNSFSTFSVEHFRGFREISLVIPNLLGVLRFRQFLLKNRKAIS